MATIVIVSKAMRYAAPTPTAGNVYMMTEQQVRRLDVPVAAATKCIMQLGAGKLLNPALAKVGKTPIRA